MTESTLEELFAEKYLFLPLGYPWLLFRIPGQCTDCATWPLHLSAFSRHVKLYYFEVPSTYSFSHSYSWLTHSSLHTQKLFNGSRQGSPRELAELLIIYYLTVAFQHHVALGLSDLGSHLHWHLQLAESSVHKSKIRQNSVACMIKLKCIVSLNDLLIWGWFNSQWGSKQVWNKALKFV